MLIRQFLYPSEDDLYKLVRFLVGKLSESPGARTSPLGDEDSGSCAAKEKLGGTGKTAESEEILNGLNDLKLKTHAFESSYRISQGDITERSAEPNSNLRNVKIMVEDSKTQEQVFSPIGCSKEDCSSYLSEEFEGLRKNASRDQGSYQVKMQRLHLILFIISSKTIGNILFQTVRSNNQVLLYHYRKLI